MESIKYFIILLIIGQSTNMALLTTSAKRSPILALSTTVRQLAFVLAASALMTIVAAKERKILDVWDNMKIYDNVTGEQVDEGDYNMTSWAYIDSY